MKKIFLAVLVGIMVLSITGCRSLEKAGTKRYIEIKADLQSFDKIELVKGNIAVFKNVGDDTFYVQDKVTDRVVEVTEQDIYNYILWGDKITELAE